MKNKKSLLSLGLLALILVLGVGYAAVSSIDLTIGGSATVKNAELSVDIESVDSSSTGSAKITHTIGENTCVKEDTFTITDMVLNEEYTITYTIKNHETDVDALLTESVKFENSNPEYFSASYKIVDAEDNVITTLPAEEEARVIVTVKLIQTPVIDTYNSATIGFTITASAVDNHQETGE